jgi:hypothetical protein
MHVGAEFSADSQPPELVQPRQRPFYPPPVLAQPRSEEVASTGELGADGAEPTAVDRAGSGLVAPPMARTWLESTSARDQSSWSASRSSPSRI